MAKARKILARRKAIGSIHTVTRTMERVATARFRRAFQRISGAREYIEGMRGMVDELLEASEGNVVHPLLVPPKRLAPRVVLVLTSSRGLCGGYNSSLQRLGEEHIRGLRSHGRGAKLYVAGKKGCQHFRRGDWELAGEYPELEGPGATWHRISDMADAFMADYQDGTIGGVDVVFGRLIGSGAYEPAVEAVLPMRFARQESEARDSEATTDEQDDTKESAWLDLPRLEIDDEPEEWQYEYVPSAKELMARLLPMTVRLQLYQCFMQAGVTEQIARMAAMRQASESAEEMIKSLNIRYNRMRQAQITTELGEIMGGAEALAAQRGG